MIKISNKYYIHKKKTLNKLLIEQMMQRIMDYKQSDSYKEKFSFKKSHSITNGN